jgi:hypothetical protein
MRVTAAIFAALISLVLFALWTLVGIGRVANCGPAEGGGSCSPNAATWLLLAGAVAAAVSAVLLLVLRRRS